jgi:ADP-heptose:LPS heptosyltransferase
MKICIIRLSSMGDVILATPLFSYLAQEYPSASITFVTGSDYAGLFADDPRLSAVIAIEKQSSAHPALAADEWDMVVDLQNSGRSRAIAASLRTQSRAKFFTKLHWKRFLLLFLRMNVYAPREHVAARYIRAAGGVARDAPALRLYFRESARVEALAEFNSQAGGIIRPSIALFPFSAWKNKEWPSGNFINVGRYFLTKGWNVAVMGGPADADRADWMRRLIGARCISLAGKLSLYQSGCLLAGFALALGNDTGMSHLARACGVKTGILYGPTSRHFGFYPFGEPPFKIFEERLICRPCHAHGGNVCARLSHRCMRKIDLRKVIQGLDELIHAQ